MFQFVTAAPYFVPRTHIVRAMDIEWPVEQFYEKSMLWAIPLVHFLVGYEAKYAIDKLYGGKKRKKY